MIFKKLSIAKIDVKTMSVIYKLFCKFEFGSFNGLSMAIVTVDMMMTIKMIGSK